MRNLRRKAAALVAGLALVAGSTIGAESPAQAAAGCDTALPKYVQVVAGTKGAPAETLECLLDQAGFATTINASFSADDAAALAKFRASIRLKPLPVAGRRAWSALLAQGSTPTLRSGSRGEDVLRLQQSLRAAGYSKVTDTSTFDVATRTAVKAAQESRSLRQTGVVGPTVWRALQNGKINAKTAVKKPVAKAPTKKPAKKKAVKKKASDKGAKVLAFAKRQLGDRYAYGGTGPNKWDCSGLTQGAYKKIGVKLPRTSQAQYKRGKKISKSNLKKGDLVFFYSGISHVGIYAGNGKIIHASRPGKPVQYIKMKYMPYKGARRPR